MRANNFHYGISGTFMTTIVAELAKEAGIAFGDKHLIDFSFAPNEVQHKLLDILSTWPLAKDEPLDSRLLNYIRRGHDYRHGVIIESLVAMRDGHNWKFVIVHKDKISTIANNWQDSDIVTSNDVVTIVRPRPQFLTLKASEGSCVTMLLERCEEKAKPLNFGDNLPDLSSLNTHSFSIDTEYGVYSIVCKAIMLNNEEAHPDTDRLLFTFIIRDCQVSFTKHGGESIQCKLYGTHHAKGSYRQGKFADLTMTIQREHAEFFLTNALAAIHSFDAENITGMTVAGESEDLNK